MIGAPRATLLAAVVANVLGWVLPAFSDERGWAAFVFALSPLWDYGNFESQSLGLLAFIVSSALTNVLFAALAIVLVLGAARRAKPALWAAAAATLLNLYWPILLEADRTRLEPGFFIWVCSFALLALSAFLTLRSEPR
ncbi:MAG TPA: hypothetical protein VGL98_17230 [Gammaproteobacteria bacterium]